MRFNHDDEFSVRTPRIIACSYLLIFIWSIACYDLTHDKEHLLPGLPDSFARLRPYQLPVLAEHEVFFAEFKSRSVSTGRRLSASDLPNVFGA